MGFLDKLAEKAVDEATASHRSAAAARRAFRGEVVLTLQDYGQRLEMLRVELHRVRDDLVRTERRRVQGSDASLFAESARDFENLVDSTWEWEPHGIEHARLQKLVPELFEPDVDPILQARAIEHFEGPDGYESPGGFRQVDEATRALDSEWAQVRPLLDDLLAQEAVAFLRHARHQLRSALNNVIHSFEIVRLRNGDPVSVERAVDGIDNVLSLADGWASHISAIRSSVHDGRVSP